MVGLNRACHPCTRIAVSGWLPLDPMAFWLLLI
jgi:hypothetical protein